ncbi:unnamed protein product [Cladocopium goreaui]|uniref:Uncharacterized protein n=1 Tax=Cladocopium goreaui TaxID=2562237 RepID=A0A9P1DEU5_9DINO|nr:unnamed protein product [Cladocopium goreaui]
MSGIPPPCAPAAPAAALQRHRRKRTHCTLEGSVSTRDGHWAMQGVRFFVLGASNWINDDPWPSCIEHRKPPASVVMNRKSPGLRGTFASWLRDMAGDGSVTSVSAFTAAMNSRDVRQLGQAGPCEVQGAIQALERFVADVATTDGDIPSFVAVRGGALLRSQLGDAAFQTTALWLDLSVDELMTETATALQGVKAFLETREISGPQPLLQTLLPALQGQEALKVVICGPADDPAIGAAHDQLSSLLQLAKTAEDAASCLELSSLVPQQGVLGDLLASAFQDIRCSHIALSEFLTGEVCLKDFGFPGHILPKLHMKYQVTNQDRVKLHLVAESAMEDFEARGWSSSSRSGVLHLADCYELPPEVLTTSSVRSFARSQDQHDPLVRTIARLREDVSCAVALLPLCATHPFNMIRVLQLGGIHSLLALLADSSSLAERRGEAMEELSDAEISAMVLMVLCASSAIRRFLVSQGIFELLAVAVRYPSSSRQLQIFCALLVRLLRDPEHRPQQLGQPLAEQLGDLLQRPDATLSAQAVAAASAALSPFLPVEAFEPLLPQLGSAARTPEAFKALCASLTLSVSTGDVSRLNVPRLLSLIPVDPPKGILFHHGALCALALCGRTAAMTSLCRPWVVSAAMALLRSAMTSPLLPLKELKVALPLAMAADEAAPPNPTGATELNCEVEEKMRMKRTFGGTWRTATPEPDTGPVLSTPRLRKQRLLGLAQRWPREQLAASPNAADFQERPQVRLEIFDEHTELFLALSALPVCKCPSSDASPEGQMGFWICECPEEQRDKHQLDLKAAVHVSASTSHAEHLVSVALPRGLYTLVPFSSHQVADATRIKAQCRKQLCGCVDLNLHQKDFYELGTRFLYLSIWGEATEISIQATQPWFQRLRLRWPLLTAAMPLWLCPKAATEVLICITGDEEESLRHSEPCLDLWPLVPHRRVRNERTGALRIHIPRLTGNLRITCMWQEPQDCERTPQLLVYSSDPLEAFAPRKSSPELSLPPGACEMPREIQNFWQSSVLCAGSWTSGFSSGFGSLRNPQVVLEVIRGPSRGEELQLEIYLCIPARKDKEAARPKASFTIFARQEESGRAPGAPERLAEGVLRRELARAKTAVGSYVMTSLSLCGAESRQQLYCVLQNDALQETWPWQLRILARIRAKDGEAGQAGLSQPVGTPDEPPLRCAVLGGWAEPGRIYTCWPELAEDETAGRGVEHLSYAWMRDEWSYEAPQVDLSSGALVQTTSSASPSSWPPVEPLPQLEAGEEMDVTTQLVPPQIQVDPEDAPERPQTLAQRMPTRKASAVPPLPKRLVLRSDPPASPATETPTPENDDVRPVRNAAVPRPAELDAKPPSPLAPPSQLQRRARMEQLLRRRKHGRERIMPEAEFYREAVRPGRQHSASLPPGPRATEHGERADAEGGEWNGQNGPSSARGTRSPSLPPIEQELRCCNFAGHPVFCCRGAAASEHQAVRRHLVRLQRDAPDMQRLGFGNVVAGPPHAPATRPSADHQLDPRWSASVLERHCARRHGGPRAVGHRLRQWGLRQRAEDARRATKPGGGVGGTGARTLAIRTGLVPSRSEGDEIGVRFP